MFSVTSCVGGIKIIKENDEPVAWIDTAGDLQFPSLLEDSEKDPIISFLDKNHIAYNKGL
ncbi:MAG: hypothetical protein J6A04_07490 [Clostridia bacterium]|nr:hypothetical protein [Clostridia bacterium]